MISNKLINHKLYSFIIIHEYRVLAVINQWLSYYWNNNDSDHLPKIIDFLTVASNPLNQSYSDNAIDILFKVKKKCTI